MADTMLDISIEPVKKLPSPLLVLGLGGTGADIVRTIKHVFAERYVLPKDGNGRDIPVPEQTAYLAIDSDKKSEHGFDSGEFISITIPGLKAILDPQKRDFNMSPGERQWVNPNLDSESCGSGAGTYRQAARFMLSRNYSTVYNAIKGALTGITSVMLGAAGHLGRTEIVIATGICGGTGSGTFLDVAQIVRHCMATEAALSGLQYKITGYIAMPDISLSNVQGSAVQTVLKQNGYAALKELDFWMDVARHKTPYVTQYSASPAIAWTMAPFDNCIMMSGVNAGGTVYANAYDVMQQVVAENLLHYLADEVPAKNNSGKPEYTYISYEDNLKAIVTAMPKRLPVRYGYRAIGAYTKRIPKRKLLYYEGSLLFGTFMPQRDAHGRLVPNDALLKDGKANARAQKIVGDVRTLYANFAQAVHLPNFCGAVANNDAQLRQLRAMSPLPHDRRDVNPSLWLTSVITPAALRAADAYLDGAWRLFTNFTQKVLSDPELGPYSMLAYLDDPNQGLLKELKALSMSWDTFAANFTTGVTSKYEACRATWADFLKPPVMGGRRAVEAYLKAMVDYYDAERKRTFMQAHAEALQKLVKRVQEYKLTALTPLCTDIEALEGEFTRADGTGSMMEGDIFDLATVQPKIDEDFKLNDTDRDHKVSRDFLNLLCEASLRTEKSVDAQGTGVAFTYGRHGVDEVLRLMRESLATCFGAINGQSLDAIMLSSVGDDPTAQKNYMDTLVKGVTSSAMPMFSQDAACKSEPVAPYSYLSVPDDAPMHIAHYQNTLAGQNILPKGSSMHDHIYCITAWDGLPLYRYSLMDQLEQAYYNCLPNVQISMGLHLVWDGKVDTEYNTNWTKLPSPRPFYFFSAVGQPQEVQTFDKVRQLVDRAVDCGMLDIDATLPVPVYCLRIFYDDPQHTVVRAAQNIIAQLDALLAKKDPVTGHALNPEQKQVVVDTYLAAAENVGVANNEKPECMAPYMGLNGQPCDPWDAATAASPDKLAVAKANHKKLTQVLAAAQLARYPHLLRALSDQVEGFEHAADITREITHRAQMWQPRISYAPTVAEMFIYSIVSPSMTGWNYTDATGESVSAIQDTLLDPAIATETPMVKLAAHLGDLKPDNPVRQALEHLLQLAKDDLTKKVNAGTHTKDDLAKPMDRIAKLNVLLTNERNSHIAKARAVDADAATLTNIAAALTAMDAVSQAEKSKLDSLLMFM